MQCSVLTVTWPGFLTLWAQFFTLIILMSQQGSEKQMSCTSITTESQMQGLIGSEFMHFCCNSIYTFQSFICWLLAQNLWELCIIFAQHTLKIATRRKFLGNGKGLQWASKKSSSHRGCISVIGWKNPQVWWPKVASVEISLNIRLLMSPSGVPVWSFYKPVGLCTSLKDLFLTVICEFLFEI